MEANGPSTLYLAIIAAFIFVLFDLDRRISWKWLTAGVVVSVIFMAIVPAIHLDHWFNTLIGIFDLFSIVAIYVGLSHVMKKKWLVFIFAVVLTIIAAMLLSILISYFYDM